MKSSTVSVLIISFIAIVIGVAFLSALADTTKSVTDTATSTNESFSAVQNTYVALDHADLISVTGLRNASGSSFNSGNYTLNTTDGGINVTQPSGTYYIDYSYYPTTYVQNGTSRTLTGLVVVFFAIGVLGLVLYYWWPQLQELFK